MINIKPDSTGNKFRKARIDMLKTLVAKSIAEKGKCAILDIGGTYNFWHIWRDEIDWETTTITCVNHDPHHSEEGKEESNVTMIKGDACNLSDIADKEYDVVFSNSVIEHVGTWKDMVLMANEVKRVSTRYLVQTPNYWFPIEPHARTPMLHWLPEPIAYRIVMARRCGYWPKQDTVDGAVLTIQSAKLVDYRQLQALFSEAEIVREKFIGLTKSLIALKSD